MRGWNQTLITAPGPGAAVTAAAATSLLPSSAKFPLPPGFFQDLGQQLEIEASGIISTAITTPGTPNFDVRFGSTTIFDGLAMLLDTVAAHTNKAWWLKIMLSLQVQGSVAQLMGHGWFQSEVVRGSGAMPLGVLTAMLPWNSSPGLGTAFDAGVSQLVDLRWTQTVATGSIQLQQFRLTAPNSPL